MAASSLLTTRGKIPPTLCKVIRILKKGKKGLILKYHVSTAVDIELEP